MRRLAKLVGTLLVVVLLIVIVAFGVLQTSSAKRSLSSWLSELLTDPEGVSVRIAGLRGVVPLDFELEELVLGDAGGEWLRIEGISADLDSGALAAGNLRFNTLSAERIDFARLPRLPEDEEEEPSSGPPQALRRVIVGDLSVAALRLGAELVSPPSIEGGDEGQAAVAKPVKWSVPIAVEANGGYGLHDEDLQLRIALTSVGLDGMLPPAVALRAGNVRVAGTFDGPLLFPTAAISISITSPEYADMGARELLVEIRGDRVDRLAGEESYKVSLDTTLQEPRVSDLIDALLGDQVRLALQGQIDPQAERIRVASIALDAAGLSAETSGRVEQGEDIVVPSLRIDLNDLGRLGGPAGEIVAGGKVGIDAAVEADAAAGTASGSATVRTTGLDLTDAGLQRLLGPQIALSGRFEVDRARVFRFTDLRIDADQASVRGDVFAHGEPLTLDADLTVEIADLSGLSTTLGTEVGGRLTIAVKAEGPFDSLAVDAVAQPQAVTVAAGPALSGTVTAHAADVTGNPNGTVRAELGSSYGDITTVTDFAVTAGETLSLSGLGLQSAGALVRGQASIDLDAGLVDAKLDGEFTDLSPLSPFVGGRLAGRGKLDARLSSAGGEQAAEMSLALQDVGLAGATHVTAQSLEARASLTALTSEPRGTVTAKAVAVAAGDVSIDAIGIDARAEAGVWRIDANANGQYLEPFRVDATAAVDTTGERVVARLRALDGGIGNRNLKLNRELVYRQLEDGFLVDQVDVDLAGAHLRGRWKMTDAAIDGSVDVVALPLDLVEFYDPAYDVQGTIVGRITGSGTSEKPDVRFELGSDGIIFGKKTRGLDLPPIATTLSGRIDRRAALIDVALRGGDATAFDLHAEIPLATAGADVSVDLDGTADLGFLNGLTVLGEDKIGGTLTADLRISGSAAAPEVAGEARLAGGFYENAAIGAVLRDIDVWLAGQGTRLTLTRLTATDGGNGRLDADGGIDFSKGMTSALYGLRLGLKSVKIARLDDLSAEASGDIRLVGAGSSPRVTGKIRAERADVRIPDQLPPHVVDLQFVEENVAAARPARYTTPERPETIPVVLDLSIEAPGRVFVRGTDIDTEWSGDVVISGTSTEPILNGDLSLVRGTFRLLNVRLKAVKGKISFDGDKEIDPIIDVVGEAKKHGILARVNVSGRATTPKISLSSEPPLPEDEILSKLLFGRSPTELSAVESFQLAAAVARLSGKAPAGSDPLGWMRRTFNVDTFAVETPDSGEGGAALSVGKYVREGVYVSVNQGLTESTSAASVEVDITDHITLDTEVGSDAQGSLGINWKWDY